MQCIWFGTLLRNIMIIKFWRIFILRIIGHFISIALRLWSKIKCLSIYSVDKKRIKSSVKVGGNEKQCGLGREWNVLFPFPLVTVKWIGDYFLNKRYAPNFGASIYTCLLRKWRCDQIRSANYKLELISLIFFLFGPCVFLRSEHSVRK
jgi:hypothetical protein